MFSLVSRVIDTLALLFCVLAVQTIVQQGCRLDGSQTCDISWFALPAFSNHGRSGGSQTAPILAAIRNSFSNHGRSGGSQTRDRRGRVCCGSVTMADQAVLKRDGWNADTSTRSVTMADQAVLKPVGVDMPFELGIPISKNCKICQVFLFLRPARSFFRSGSRISASVYSRPDDGMDPL